LILIVNTNNLVFPDESERKNLTWASRGNNFDPQEKSVSSSSVTDLDVDIDNESYGDNGMQKIIIGKGEKMNSCRGS